MATVSKVDVKPAWWDNIFAPSSCLVLITTVDREGRVNAAAFGTCTRVCHEPMYIAFTCGTGKDTYNNILATGEFVVNVVPFEQAMLDKVLTCGLPFKVELQHAPRTGTVTDVQFGAHDKFSPFTMVLRIKMLLDGYFGGASRI